MGEQDRGFHADRIQISYWDELGNETVRNFAANLPGLRAIAFNGGKASEIGRRALGDGGGLALVTLPSSSPAHTMAFETKKAAWMGLAEFVGRPTDPSSK